MASVAYRSISKSFGETRVISDLDLEIADGEFVAYVGPSGCGKTTLLRLLSGLEPVSNGEIWIGENDVTHKPPKERNVAMVFQNYALYPHMNVAENIGFGLRVRGSDRGERDEAVKRAAEMLSIDHLLSRKPRELSGGQRQRVAMGRAIVRDPAVFLMDEPLSNLDAQLRTQMRSEIRSLQKRLGATMIYVTHDQIEAMTMADRIVVLKDGVIQQIGTPDELYRAPANRFVAGFIGVPAMNLVPVLTDGREIRCLGESTRADVPDATAEIGIRPQDIHLTSERPYGAIVRDAEVSLVEPMGGEALIHVRAGESVLRVRQEGTPTVHEGETVRVCFRPTDAHYFDHSGRAV